MEIYKDQYFEGERPLYARRDGLYLERVKIGPGESSIKEGANIEAVNCEFNGKYPFWECDGFVIRDCLFREGARAALWYTRHCKMYNTLVEAPKMFRRITDTYLENVQLPNALETFWDCDGVVLRNVQAQKADYIFMHTHDIDIDGFRLQGNYSFQYARNVVIRNADMDTKDAFWESENVTVYNSRIQGEFLAWYSKNLRLVNCHIGGTQPLCYCENLILENCTFEPDADLAFVAGSYGEIILDANIKAPGNCEIIDSSLRSE